jgi:MerR family copper efflux transcriptional regulator
LTLDSIVNSRLYTEHVNKDLRIGEVARRSGIGVETLRFYEKSGLLSPAGRTASGYRLYAPGIFERLDFIRKAQSVGFALDEIARLIRESEEGRRPCAEVRRLASDKLSALDKRIAQLTRYRAELAETLDAWEREGAVDGHVCGLIESLHGGRPHAPRKEPI